jgi:carbon storage regulator CsrA
VPDTFEGIASTPFVNRDRSFREGYVMLVLSRKIGESINIGEGIQVKVIEVREGKVRLGFSAPLDVNIRRQELERVPVPRSAPGRKIASALDPVQFRSGHPIGMALEPDVACLDDAWTAVG